MITYRKDAIVIQTLLGNAKEIEKTEKEQSLRTERKYKHMQHCIAKRLYKCLWNIITPAAIVYRKLISKNVQNLKGIVRYFLTL